jgi:hypothetical protein
VGRSSGAHKVHSCFRNLNSAPSLLSLASNIPWPSSETPPAIISSPFPRFELSSPFFLRVSRLYANRISGGHFSAGSHSARSLKSQCPAAAARGSSTPNVSPKNSKIATFCSRSIPGVRRRSTAFWTFSHPRFPSASLRNWTSRSPNRGSMPSILSSVYPQISIPDCESATSLLPSRCLPM